MTSVSVMYVKEFVRKHDAFVHDAIITKSNFKLGGKSVFSPQLILSYSLQMLQLSELLGPCCFIVCFICMRVCVIQ